MTAVQLIRVLADGNWKSVNVSSTLAAELTGMGLQIEKDAAGRCRLSEPIELLQVNRILPQLRNGDSVSLQIVDTIPSTNTALMDSPTPGLARAQVLAAEYQQAGRGRQGRSWQSPFAGGLCLSIAWRFDPAPQHPGTLSLAVGVGVLRALQKLGINDTGLKWPNDLIVDNAKIGGILAELRNTSSGMDVVAGIGLNLRLDDQIIERIETDRGLRPGVISPTAELVAAGRNGLAAVLIDELTDMFRLFQQKGFATLRQEWNHADVLHGQTIEVSGPVPLSGVADGVDETGALLLRSDDAIHQIYSGEVRVRKS
ncbi:MAG: biotin--[acetyl-CoA-carboxylase] ligase [Gammaproteobacteria bacterium]|nr:biotin--[acetyl-CoA-carboxylase] ligase [Gammaproteobacteria bacterium]